MSVRGLQWQTLSVPLAAGLNQKGDARAGNPPSLDICTNAMFDEVGGLQTRYPFSAIGNSIVGGGAITNARKLAVNGDELLCFTKDALYSWSPAFSAWVLRGTHLAAKIDEETVFATTGDQVEADRAELGSVVLYTWREGANVYLAARDKTTGAILLSPVSYTASRPRLIALTNKILFFVAVTGGDLSVRAIDPLDPATGAASAATSVIAAAAFNSYYDVVKVIGADQVVGVARRAVTTSYELFTVTEALAVATATKARIATEPVAISCIPAGTHAQIFRGDSATANVLGDLVAISTFADVAANQAIGTFTSGINQITAAHRTVADGGAYRCYAFWSSSETASGLFNTFATKYNYVDTAGAIGTQAVLVRMLGVGSRAFDHDGRVFVWAAFGQTSTFTGTSPGSSIASNVQNAYYLYRDDAFLVAKSVYSAGGGHVATQGHLPYVASSGSAAFSFCACKRRKIEVGSGVAGGVADVSQSYAMRAPHDVKATFDSNAARRSARLGQSLYIAAGELLAYDGRQITEAGFHVAPWFFSAAQAGAAAGTLADGTYAYSQSWRWLNAKGETDRSTAGTVGNVTISGGPRSVSVESIFPLTVTHKTASAPAVEIWRTAVNPTFEAPFYLASQNDPAQTANPNRYIANDPAADYFAAFTDSYPDETLTTKETHPETGAILESLAPPAASIILANETRLFLAGIAGDPDRVWYSKSRGDGEIAAFHEALTFTVPHAGGVITGLAFLDSTLVVFRERAIYAFPGDGFANDGSGANYGPARVLSTDLGATAAEGIAAIEQGLIFKSSKGWYVLNRGLGFDYVGAPVVDYDSESPLSVHVLTARHQIRILTASRMLVWDYLVNQWSNWTVTSGLDSVFWSNTHHYLITNNVLAESGSYSSLNYGMEIETPWIKLDDLQGYGRVRRLLVLGEYRSAHLLRIRIARDYKATGTNAWDYFDDELWSPGALTAGAPEQVRIGPSQQQCQAIKIRITVLANDSGEPPGQSNIAPGSITAGPAGEAIKFTGLALEIGLKRGPYPMLTSVQKT